MTKLLGTETRVPDPEVLTLLRSRAKPGDRWMAYENHDLGHRELGHLQFLQVGPERTYKTAPERMPDTQQSLNWRYVLVGEVSMVTGQIVENQ